MTRLAAMAALWGATLTGCTAPSEPPHDYRQAVAQAENIARRADVVAALSVRPTQSAAQRREIEVAWRNEAKNGGAGPVITGLLAKPLSQRLASDVAQSNGQIEQIMVIDRVGALVAADHATHDYDQSDEEKWQKTVGTNTLSPLYEGSEQTARGITDQISHAVRGPGGTVIGAVTVRWCNTAGGCR